MSLRREILIVLVIKIMLIVVLKNTFFDAPTISEDREALQKRLISPGQNMTGPAGATTP